MELRQIQYFIQLYKDSNITKASKNLFISQQGLSKSINRLEEELGFPLFDRSASGVVPTKSAKHLYDYFNRISGAYHELEIEIENLRENRILKFVAHHGFALSCGKIPFSEYGNLHPESGMHYEEIFNWDIPEYLLDRKADIAFMQGPVPGGLVSHQLIGIDPLCAVMDRSHPLAGKECLTLTDLEEQDFILLNLMKPFNTQLLSVLDQARVNYNIYGTAQMNEYLPVIHSSQLIGFSTRSIYQYYNFPEIVFIPVENPPQIMIETHLVTSSDLTPDEETQQYIDYIKNKGNLL